MSKKHVHIVEDSEITVYTLNTALGEEYDVSFSMNGEEFLRSFKMGLKADLYIVDLNLPDIDGFAILKILKTANVAKIVYSAQTAPEIIEACFNLGAYDFLKKPTPIKEFKAKIFKALQYYEIIQHKGSVNLDEVKGTVAHFFGQPLTALGAEIYLLKKELGLVEAPDAYSSLLRLEKAYEILVAYYNTFKNMSEPKKMKYLNDKNILDIRSE